MREQKLEEVLDVMERVLGAALRNLQEAATALDRAYSDWGRPLPRPRKFIIAPGVVWPGGNPADLMRVRVDGEDLNFVLVLSTDIVKRCRGQPRLVLRAVRRLQAAAAWCHRRADGLKRAIQNEMAQQHEALADLEAELVLKTLGEAP